MDHSKSSDTIVTYPVQTITLDEAMANETTLDFLKMDTEGAECSILEGADSLFEKSPNMKIIMEWKML